MSTLKKELEEHYAVVDQLKESIHIIWDRIDKNLPTDDLIEELSIPDGYIGNLSDHQIDEEVCESIDNHFTNIEDYIDQLQNSQDGYLEEILSELDDITDILDSIKNPTDTQ